MAYVFLALGVALQTAAPDDKAFLLVRFILGFASALWKCCSFPPQQDGLPDSSRNPQFPFHVGLVRWWNCCGLSRFLPVYLRFIVVLETPICSPSRSATHCLAGVPARPESPGGWYR